MHLPLFDVPVECVQGMKYVHSSLLRFHGSLRSVNCVIDSRWVLKVTDYGVNQFYQKCKAKRPLADKGETTANTATCSCYSSRYNEKMRLFRLFATII